MPVAPTEFAALIGIDWADRKHDFCLQVPGVDGLERGVLAHQPAAIEDWARALRERFGGAPVAVAIELSRGPIVSALLEHDFFVLFPVNPSMLAQYRRAFTPSRAKDDPTDAELALDLLVRHPERLTRLRRQSASMRALQRVVEDRRALVHDRVRITNRITHALKAYFPQVVDWFRDKEAAVFADFLEKWPTLETAQRARDKTLLDFFHGHNVRRPAAIDTRIAAIRAERPLTTDPAVIGPARLLVAALLPQLRAVTSGISRFDAEVERLCAELADYRLFRALPGAGPVFAARLLAAFGEHRERFPSAACLQRYAGVAPVTERSGNKSWVHWRFACPTFLRQTFVEWAAESIPRSFWARAFYDRHRAKGASRNAALRALAFKWIRILFRCWVDRTPYDESRYLTALQKRQSPVLKFAAEVPA
jgi:transposase